MTRHEEAQKDNKIKAMIDFEDKQQVAWSWLTSKKNSAVNLRTRFMIGKMLIFSKTSLCRIF